MGFSTQPVVTVEYDSSNAQVKSKPAQHLRPFFYRPTLKMGEI
jgi:hypothetical protein